MKKSLHCLFLGWLLCPQLSAQNAGPEVAGPASSMPALSSTSADSPVKLPEKGSLPSPFRPDVKVQNFSAESNYSIFESPCRSLEQIRAIQAVMPKGEFAPLTNDWRHLERTRRLLTEGGKLHILALGDSIINDTMRSGWVALLREAYPQTDIEATVYIRGGGGCRHYRHEERVQKCLLPRKPDLVMIGGISQAQDEEAIRDVIGQIRAGLPECEILLTSGVFGSADPRSDEAMAATSHSGTGDYGAMLGRIAKDLRCAYFDMTTPWLQYIRSSGEHPHVFYRNRVHANAEGEQILAKILIAWWTASDP